VLNILFEFAEQKTPENIVYVIKPILEQQPAY